MWNQLIWKIIWFILRQGWARRRSLALVVGSHLLSFILLSQPVPTVSIGNPIIASSWICAYTGFTCPSTDSPHEKAMIANAKKEMESAYTIIGYLGNITGSIDTLHNHTESQAKLSAQILELSTFEEREKVGADLLKMSGESRLLAGKLKRIYVKGQNIMADILELYAALRTKVELSMEGNCTPDAVRAHRVETLAEVKNLLAKLRNLVTDTQKHIVAQVERSQLVRRALYREEGESKSKTAQIEAGLAWWKRIAWIRENTRIAKLSDPRLDQLLYNLQLVYQTLADIESVSELLNRLYNTLEGFEESILATESAQVRAELFGVTLEELLQGFGLKLNMSRTAIQYLELPPPEGWKIS